MSANLLHSRAAIGALGILLSSAVLFAQTPPVKVYEMPPSSPAAQPTPTRPGVEIIAAKELDASVLAARKASYSFDVSGSDWVDTGVMIAAGDVLEFSGKGQVTLSDGRVATTEGTARGWKDLLRIYPLNSANCGALIGRIGSTQAALPFAIGARKTIAAVSAGPLFLNMNVSSDLNASGSFQVKMTFGKAAATKTAASAPDIVTLVSPALFVNIPRRVEDENHNPGDMVNFALIGTAEQVKSAFTAAGWVAVDKTKQDAIVNGLLATLAQKAYTAMPMSTLFLFGRPQDLSFAHAEPLKVAAFRHHLRVWKTTQTLDGRPLWVGSATYDNGFEKDQRTGGVTHSIDPNIDTERDFIEQSFSAAGVVAGAAYVTPGDPLTFAKTATGGSFHSDGRIVVMNLK